MIDVIDRVPTKPGQYIMTDSNGTEKTVTLVRDDHPTVEGTPINKALFDSIRADTLTFSNVPITWATDSTYADYGYKGTMTCEGVTADYSADCRLSAEMVTSGIYASFTNTATNKVYIYASEEGASTCPVVIATKVV